MIVLDTKIMVSFYQNT